MKKLHTLPNGLFIYQDDKEFKFTLDAILLAAFAKICKNKNIIDLGTGTGAISMLISCKEDCNVTGIDINNNTLSLFGESIIKNNLENKVFAQQCDIKNVKESFGSGQFDIVVTNPPYRKIGHGKLRAGSARDACHEEHTTTLDFIIAAKYLLKYGGKFNIVHLPERLDEILSYCTLNKLQPKRLQFVHSNKQKKSTMFLLEAIHGGKSGLTVLPPLFVYDDKNNYTSTVLSYYNCFDKKQLENEAMKLQETGVLYLCATPIGNLDDITFRLVKTLQQVDLIAAEDTIHTKKLLNHLQINKKLFSYHEHNKDRAGNELIALLIQGKNIALVSDAGYPAIADPGEHLVQLAIEANIKTVPVPGANAALCALIVSGLCTTPFFFGGFLPKTKKHRREKLFQWQEIKSTIILYEAPHRIKQVLAELNEIFGDRQIVLAREITKLYEEFFRGSIQEGLLWLENKPPRGEFTIVIQEDTMPKEQEDREEVAFLKLCQFVKEGFDKKESMKKIAQEFGVKKNELYRRLLEEDL